MFVTFRKLNLSNFDLRHLDYRETAISAAVGLVGLSIVLLSLFGTTYLMDLVDSENQLSYLKILMCSLGIFTIGLALIIFSIHLVKKIIWGALAALLLVSFGLGCFAFGIFVKCFLIGFFNLYHR
ncbi:hypothetical protein F7C95_07710 [Opitutia bacterium ISCC 51]|nr:hypothetical protein F7C95_07710 [Opitutae bacterium ISCC 51]QXD29827.1 hypothetical protein GA003_07670 [Opitutae bacterium ISCC 52]